MRSIYMHLAHRTLQFNKKRAIASTFSISFFIALTIAIPLISLSVNNFQYTSLINHYGEYDFTLFDVNSNNANLIQEYENVDEIGTFLNCGLCSTEENLENTFILGAMDEKALQLSKIIVDEGRIPIHSGEIALERSMMLSLNIPTKLNQPVSLFVLSVDGTKTRLITYYVVGILDDYSKYQSNNTQERSIHTNLPNCLISVDDAQLLPHIINCLVSVTDKANANFVANDLVLGLELAKQFFINERLNSSALYSLQNSTSISMLKIFVVGVAFITILGVYCIYISLCRILRPTAAKICLLGGCKQHIVKYAFSVLLQIGKFALILSFLILGVLLSSIKAFTQTVYSSQFTILIDWKLIGIFTIIGIIIVVVICYSCVLSCNKSNPLDMVSQYRSKKISDTYKLNIHNPLVLWGIKSALCNRAEMVTVCIISSLGIALFIVFMFFHCGTKVDFTTTISTDYYIMPQRTDTYTALRIPANISLGVEEKDVNSLLCAQEIGHIQALKRMPMNIIVDNKQGSLFDNFFQQEKLGLLETHEDFEKLKNEFGYSPTSVLYSCNVFEVDNETLNQIKPYLEIGHIDINALSNATEILVIAKDENQPFKVGDKVDLTQLILPDDGLIEGASQFNLTTSVGGIIILDEDSLDVCNLLTRSGFSFAFFGNTFSHLGLDIKYTNIFITLADQMYCENIEPFILSIPDKYLQMKVISQRAQKEELDYTLNLIDTTHAIFLLIISLSFLISFLSIVHSRNIQRKRVYAMIRAIGVSKAKLAIFACIETSLLAIVSWLIGAIVAIMICFYWGDNWRNDWSQYFPFVSLPLSFFVLLCLSAIVSVISTLYTQGNTVVDSLHYDG